MNTTIKTRVAELSATLQPIQYPLTESAFDEVWGESEEFISYNGRYDAYYHTQTCYDGTVNACVLESNEDYQILRFFAVGVYNSGECYRKFLYNEKENEDREDWMDDEIYEQDELETTDITEYKQVWIDRYGDVEVVYLEDSLANDSKCFVKVDSLADFAFEPRIREVIHNYINEITDFCYTDNYDQPLSFYLSQTAEYLKRNEPVFFDIILRSRMFDDAIKFFKSFRIAHRHNWQFPTEYHDVKMYIDYLRLLEIANKFYITAPEYICPKDLQKAYDKIDKRRKELLELQAKKEAEAQQKDFKEQHSWLFGIDFEDDFFHYQSLDSVEAYRIESKIMYHCLYSHEYYKKPYYLAMHIEDLEGNRVATCTIDLLTRKIDAIQPPTNDTGFFKTYGYEWQSTKDYKRIWNTLMARMHTFPRRYKQSNQSEKIA